MLQVCPRKTPVIERQMQNWLASATSLLGHMKLNLAFDLIHPSSYPSKFSGCEGLMRNLYTPRSDLQAVWDVLHCAKESDAMLAPTQEAGVFVGIQQMEYGGLAAPYLTAVGPYSAIGTPFSVAAGRISFSFGLKGAAVSHAHSLAPGTQQ